MAVLVEAHSVIIRRARIMESYQGGWDNFVRNCPNQTLCADTDLARIGFMMPIDLDVFIKCLKFMGVGYTREGHPADYAIVSQFTGPATPCPWLLFDHAEINGKRVAICRLVGSTENSIALPAGWHYDGSLSASCVYVPPGAVEATMRFLRCENGVDVYQDLLTGQEVYAGRPGRWKIALEGGER